jgi:hypothetical protein
MDGACGMSFEVDSVFVGPDEDMPGCVVIQFANIDLSITTEQARELAYALVAQSDKAEEQAAQQPCPTCGEHGCPELHGEED